LLFNLLPVGEGLMGQVVS